MMPEQQQRILGYFIEEAKDHLNTIEQGLLSLQKTIEDNEMVNEVFRAAHSIKGGAAMLGIESVQRTAHRLEDYFKVLKESPVQTDRTLESMFLQVFDGLQSLVEELQGPFGLTEDKAQEVMGDVEPVFDQLEHHLNSLVAQAGTSGASATSTRESKAAAAPATHSASAHTEESALRLVFRSDVPGHLRDMLRLFKQTDDSESRTTLKKSCDALLRIGEQFDLNAWCELVRLANQAIGNPEQTYRALAPVIIKDIKQAQEWVLAGREPEIIPSDAMQALLPPPALMEPSPSAEGELDDLLDSALSGSEESDLGEFFGTSLDTQAVEDDLGGLFDAEAPAAVDAFDSTADLDLVTEVVTETSATTDNLRDLFELEVTSTEPTGSTSEASNDFDDLFQSESPDTTPDLNLEEGDDDWLMGSDNNALDVESPTLDANDNAERLEVDENAGDVLADAGLITLPQGPEVGAAELNSLADLFEGEMTDSPWQEDEEITQENTTDQNSVDIDISNEFSDLLLSDPEESSSDNEATGLNSQDELDNLFGDVSLDETDNSQELIVNNVELDPNSADNPDDLLQALEPLGEEGQDDLDLMASTESETSAGDLDDLLGDIDSNDALSISSTADGSDLPDAAGLDATTDDIDALFEEPIHSATREESPDNNRNDIDALFDVPASTPDVEADALDLSIDSSLAGDADLAQDDSQLETNAEFDSLFEASSADEHAALSESLDSQDLALSELDMDLSAETQQSVTDVLTTDSPSDGLDDALELMTANQPDSTDDADLGALDESSFNIDAEEEANISELTTEVDDLFSTSPTSEVDQAGVEEALPAEASQSVAAVADPWDEMELESTNVTSQGESSEGTLSSVEDPWGDAVDDSGAVDSTSNAEEALEALDNLWDIADEQATTAIDETELSEDVDMSPVAPATTDAPFDLFSGEENEIAADDGLEDLARSIEPDDVTADLDGEVDDQVDTGLEDLEAMLGDPSEDHEASGDLTDGIFSAESDLEALDALLDAGETVSEGGDLNTQAQATGASHNVPEPDFDDLDALLDGEEEQIADEPGLDEPGLSVTGSDFDELDELLGDDIAPAPDAETEADSSDEFGDLEKLLEQADQALGGGGSPTIRPGSKGRSSRRAASMDQTMRVSVKHLDTLSNLVGELVVNRNSLEQDQERLRQFLDNLLFQVQQLNDVGQRMRDLYERSLLESSLISSRQAFHAGTSSPAPSSGNGGDNGNSHATGATFDALEMDRFTGFHTLSQEMIELIVRVRESASDIGYTVESSDQITRQFRQVTTQLQEGLNKARMVPFAQTADRLPRAVRDISLKCGKEARLVVEGRDTLIDKMILERLYDPMTHLVNNAITHGIETPEERSAAGKSREGTITVRAFYQGNQTVIYIADDGGGINPDVVKQKAIKKGLLTQAEASSMSVLDTYELLFRPGFSTRDQADDFAGRGVGMDVVRTAISEIRGNITIDSDMGKGTSFTIRLPLTLSISKALSCLNNQARIAFPMDGVEDMFDVPKERVQADENGNNSILWRDTTLPFQALSDLLSFNRTLGRGRVYGGNQDEDIVSIVVLRSANAHIGLQVDRVLGEQEIVIKQLEGPVPKPVGIAGATVLGDGRVMPIADVLELIDLSQGRVRRDSGGPLWSQDDATPGEPVAVAKAEPTVLIVDDSITVRELLSMSFNKVGYRVEQARDGQEAWEKLRSGLPCDLVFCDIEMPRMDGLELLSRLQKDGTLKSVPIAMLTSRGADRHRQMAVDLGASGYFTKPYLEEALLDAAQRMLNGEVLLQAPSSDN
ncbi:MAG: response regulator [Leptolyngbyaceae cyanobacterium]